MTTTGVKSNATAIKEIMMETGGAKEKEMTECAGIVEIVDPEVGVHRQAVKGGEEEKRENEDTTIVNGKVKNDINHLIDKKVSVVIAAEVGAKVNIFSYFEIMFLTLEKQGF